MKYMVTIVGKEKKGMSEFALLLGKYIEKQKVKELIKNETNKRRTKKRD